MFFTFTPFFLIWGLTAAVNFAIEMLQFRRAQSPGLFIAKKISMPLVLFSAAVSLVLSASSGGGADGAGFLSAGLPGASSGFALAMGLLLAMTLGEIGIEGSSVVESRAGEERAEAESRKRDQLMVTLAGVIFLLVNLVLGTALLLRDGNPVAALIAIAVFLLIDTALMKFFRPAPALRNQALIYSAGIAVLFAGALSDIMGGGAALGWAALILSLSDSLVLTRMSANLDKNRPAGRTILLAFLIVILLLYYLFMFLLMQSGLQARV